MTSRVSRERVRARIGLTGQSLSVDGKLSGPENLAMFGRLHPPGLAGRA
jgi:ABC-type multidrug transport system ATPase subunit